MKLDKSFWSDKKILVTGHSGFKGSWLSCILKYLNCKVWGLSDGKTQSDNYILMDKEEIFEKEFKLDISASKSLGRIMQNNFDFVFHLAAQGLVSKAKENPRETVSSNVLGTFNILDWINNIPEIPCLIIATTDKVYSNPSIDNTENSPLGGDELYSATKSASEHIIRAFSNTLKRKSLNIGVIRSGNVLGGGDGASDRIVTDLLDSLKNKTEIILRNPEAIRPWQYIMDSLHGYLLAAEYCYKSRVDEIFNLNSEKNNSLTVRDVAESLINFWGNNRNYIITEVPSKLKETSILTINSRKAYNLLGWSASHDINSIAKNTIEWEKSKLEGINITFNQIKDHFDLTRS